jgi:hypothetical protein
LISRHIGKALVVVVIIITIHESLTSISLVSATFKGKIFAATIVKNCCGVSDLPRDDFLSFLRTPTQEKTVTDNVSTGHRMTMSILVKEAEVSDLPTDPVAKVYRVKTICLLILIKLPSRQRISRTMLMVVPHWKPVKRQQCNPCLLHVLFTAFMAFDDFGG